MNRRNSGARRVFASRFKDAYDTDPPPPPVRVQNTDFTAQRGTIDTAVDFRMRAPYPATGAERTKTRVQPGESDSTKAEKLKPKTAVIE